MDLQTKITLSSQPHSPIDYSSSIMALGSCFVENIGEKLEYFKFKNLINPFGILFNPVVIERFIDRSVNLLYYTEKEIFFLNEQWHCSDAHSKINASSKAELLKKLNELLFDSNQFLKQSTHLLLTLGTSWVYRDNESERIVANCHKRPNNQFSKELLPIDTIEKSVLGTINRLQKLNSGLQVILTVSPVRHLKDGFVENNVSKSHLLVAVNNIVNQNDRVAYFPSYEILMDELRDYRFYNQDMIHPNETAINYIWERFKSVWIDSGMFDAMNDVEAIQKGLAHKPFNPKSEAHQKFLFSLSKIQERVKAKHKHIQF